MKRSTTGNANDALLKIVELLNCPMLGTMAGRSALPLDHANFLYTYSPAADMARRYGKQSAAALAAERSAPRHLAARCDRADRWFSSGGC